MNGVRTVAQKPEPNTVPKTDYIPQTDDNGNPRKRIRTVEEEPRWQNWHFKDSELTFFYTEIQHCWFTIVP